MRRLRLCKWAILAIVSFLFISCVTTTLYNSKTVTSVSANMRNGPGINYSKITTLHKGDIVKIISKKGGWYKIKFGDLEGWMYKRLFETEGEKQARIQKAREEAKRRKKTDRSVDIRKQIISEGDKLYDKGYNVNEVYAILGWKYGISAEKVRDIILEEAIKDLYR